MSAIHEAIELVRGKEAEARRRIDEAVRKAQLLVVKADEDGADHLRRSLERARAEAAAAIADGRQEAQRAIKTIQEEAELALSRLDSRASNNIDRAAAYLTDLFRGAYCPGDVPIKTTGHMPNKG